MRIFCPLKRFIDRLEETEKQLDRLKKLGKSNNDSMLKDEKDILVSESIEMDTEEDNLQ